MIHKKLLAENFAFRNIVFSVYLRKLTDGPYLKVISLGNRKKTRKGLTEDLRYASGPSCGSVQCFPKPKQKWSQWKDVCQEAIPKKGKQREKAGICQIIQELNQKYVAADFAE